MQNHLSPWERSTRLLKWCGSLQAARRKRRHESDTGPDSAAPLCLSRCGMRSREEASCLNVFEKVHAETGPATLHLEEQEDRGVSDATCLSCWLQRIPPGAVPGRGGGGAGRRGRVVSITSTSPERTVCLVLPLRPGFI